MQLWAAWIMNGLRGGDVVVESLETVHVVGRARDSVMSAGATRSRPRLNFSGRIGLFTAKKRRTQSVGVRHSLGRPLVGKAGVWTVSTPRASDRAVHRPDRAGLGCFRGSPVFARAGVRFESHFGHVFPLVRGPWFSDCGQPAQFCGPGAGSGGCLEFSWGRVTSFLSRGTGWAFLLLHGGVAVWVHDFGGIS